MQYLKDTVRKKFEQEALKEFKQKGYRGAAIRSITKNTHTSVGNFYKYYDSKDDLYENLIGSVYHKLMDYIRQFNKVELNEKTNNLFFELTEKIMEIFEANSVELMILLNKSEGSQYENCKSLFVEFITRIVSEKMEYELSLTGELLIDNFIISLVSYNLVESIAIILREKEDGTEVRKLILDIIDIFYKNIAGKLNVINI